jgi:RimJ/RimL family protein N-acetyltransferase
VIVFDVGRIGPWVCERAGGKYFPGTCQGIGYEQDGELTAGVLYDQCNGRSVQMHVALDKPLTKGFVRICFDYVFNQLKVQKVIGLVDSNNTKALHLDRKLGFVDEAQIKDAGRTGDLVILTMTRQQCRWIK